MRLLLISLGVTGIACIILFLYFRNRFSRMEQKVDLMFQLIQEYEQNKNISPEIERDLINVSDDEYTDSDEVSDDDEDGEQGYKQVFGGRVEEQVEEPVEEQVEEQVEEPLVEQIEISPHVDIDIKSISLSGAEVESLQMVDDLDEISDIDCNSDVTITELVDNLVEEIAVTKDEEKPLKSHSVKELKIMAGERGFTNYKALRKGKLIELLSHEQIVSQID